MTEKLPDESAAEDQSAEQLEAELLDAMRKLRRKNRKVEEYLDGLARSTEKTTPESGDSAEK